MRVERFSGPSLGPNQRDGLQELPAASRPRQLRPSRQRRETLSVLALGPMVPAASLPPACSHCTQLGVHAWRRAQLFYPRKGDPSARGECLPALSCALHALSAFRLGLTVQAFYDYMEGGGGRGGGEP